MNVTHWKNIQEEQIDLDEENKGENWVGIDCGCMLEKWGKQNEKNLKILKKLRINA